MPQKTGLAVALFALGLLTGCASDTERVQDGFLAEYKSLSVSEAIETYADCVDPEWDELETDRGERLVRLTCEVPAVQHFAEHEKDEFRQELSVKKVRFEEVLNGKDKTFAREAIGEAAAAGEKNVLRRYRNDPLDYLEDCVEHREEQLEDADEFDDALRESGHGNLFVEKADLTVEFVLSKQDESIDVHGAWLTIEWENGYTAREAVDAEAVLSAVYGIRALPVEALGVGDILQKAYREE